MDVRAAEPFVDVAIVNTIPGARPQGWFDIAYFGSLSLPARRRPLNFQRFVVCSSRRRGRTSTVRVKHILLRPSGSRFYPYDSWHAYL